MNRIASLFVSSHEIDRKNNINFIRFVAAALVIYGHMAHFINASPPLLWGMNLSVIAVKVFFVLSGYLITESFLRDRNIVRYLTRRVFRIIPGLIFVCLMTAFVLGPVVTSLDMAGYFGNRGTYLYAIKNILLNPVYALPGVFEQSRLSPAVNGSLWTLPVEFGMYLVLPLVVFVFGRFRHWKFIVPVIALATGVTEILHMSLFPEWSFVFWGTDWFQAMALIPYFFIGSTYSLFGLVEKTNIQLAVTVAFVLTVLALKTDWQYEIFSYFVLSYATMAFSFALPALFGRVFAENDYSYGLYLWGFPVQQALAIYFGWNSGQLLIATLVCFIAALACAMVSWHLVEKPASKVGKRITRWHRKRFSSDHE